MGVEVAGEPVADAVRLQGKATDSEMAERVKWFWVLVVVALLGCGPEGAAPVAGAAGEPDQAGGSEDERGPYDAAAQVRPDWMRVESAEGRPGDEVKLHFPEETPRGEAFVLEERVGDGWRHRYWLTSSPAGSTRSPTWAPAGEDHDWDDIGIGGPGPDRVKVPDTAEAGQYRVCTANARGNSCAELTIIE